MTYLQHTSIRSTFAKFHKDTFKTDILVCLAKTYEPTDGRTDRQIQNMYIILYGVGDVTQVALANINIPSAKVYKYVHIIAEEYMYAKRHRSRNTLVITAFTLMYSLPV